jgi:hypothetical protein
MLGEGLDEGRERSSQDVGLAGVDSRHYKEGCNDHAPVLLQPPGDNVEAEPREGKTKHVRLRQLRPINDVVHCEEGEAVDCKRTLSLLRT